MKFLNKKEQVLDIKLTQYGKHLLSKGQFRPEYYAFYDDGVLYDGDYGNITGSQNTIQTRIISDSPKLETQYVFRGIETEVKRVNSYIRSQQSEKEIMEDLNISPPAIQPTGDREYGLQFELGTSDSLSQYAPAWDIKLLEGSVSSSVVAMTGTTNTIYIPQMNTNNIIYRTSIEQLAAGDTTDGEDLFADNTYVDIRTTDGSILLEVEEKNVFFGENNFDVEIYEVDTQQVQNLGPQTTKEVLIPLYFIKEPDQIRNNLLLDDEEVWGKDEDEYAGDSPIDSSYVEYFLDVSVDNEINPNTLCGKTLDRTQGVFSSKMLDCEKAEKEQRINSGDLYNTDVTDSDLEECE